MPGEVLLAEARDVMSADPVDAAVLENLCGEIDRRIMRGDMMIGILPVEASGVMVQGYAAAALAGRAGAWVRLGRYYLNAELRTEPVAWPSAVPFPDSGDEPVGAALRCFAEAAACGDRTGALMFASACRHGSKEAQRFALSLLDPLRVDDSGGVATYRYALVQYALGDAAAAAATQERAAAAGNADAMFELYVLHATGEGVPRSAETAHDWLVRAADRGQPRALYNVAAGLATGQGFAKDEAAAAAYYERAANAGNVQAAATLGVMLLTGQGVGPDPLAAARWLDRAEAGGSDVDDWLDRLGLQRPA